MLCPICNNCGLLGSVTGAGARESSVCLICGCTSRARAAFRALKELSSGIQTPAVLYVVGSDILTPHLRRFFLPPAWRMIVSELEGSERVENVEHLTFADASLDLILCADVLEHVRLYRKALAEFARVLKPGGAVALTVPGGPEEAEHLSWCAITDEAKPETDVWTSDAPVHRDPGSPGGCRQYRAFSYPRLFREMEEAGLSATSTKADDPEFGIVNSPVIIGRKK